MSLEIAGKWITILWPVWIQWTCCKPPPGCVVVCYKPRDYLLRLIYWLWERRKTRHIKASMCVDMLFRKHSAVCLETRSYQANQACMNAEALELLPEDGNLPSLMSVQPEPSKAHQGCQPLEDPYTAHLLSSFVPNAVHQTEHRAGDCLSGCPRLVRFVHYVLITPRYVEDWLNP